MVKLQGTAPNQAPTNADLGSLAYADHDNVNLTAADLKLKALSKTKSQTAVDVFVYDTSKDSDGGAWRHRTQHTSWYNEGASSTRGSRAEFPSVAVIVAEANKVTIYDGDDPSLPMWMVFNAVAVSSSTADWWRFQRYATCIFALNGVVIWGTGTTGCPFVSFAGDFSGRYDAGSQGGLSGSVATAEGSTVNSGSLPDLVDDAVNDVAMTVLPDAPTDPATGLPVPTIAVATDGGVSVIKDHGTVVDITHSFAADIFTTVSFTNDNRLATFLQGVKDVYVMPIPASDYSVDLSSDDTTYNEFSAPYLFSTFSFVPPSDLKPLATPDGLAIIRNETGAIHGISQLAEDPTTPANSMVAYTTSDYATGWMNGDIKLAALADTTAETLSGSELVPNGDFPAGLSDGDVGYDNGDGTVDGWTASTDVELSIVSGAIRVQNSSTYSTSHSGSGVFALTTTPNKVYVLEATVVTANAGGSSGIGVSSSNGVGSFTNRALGSHDAVGAGTYTITFTANSSTTYLKLFNWSTVASYYADFDNISVRLADPDRSVNGKGLGVHGSITKAPVATGADVVAYSGFSSSNYLEQPYNSALNFGTGDFSVMGWVSLNSTASQFIVDRADASDANRFSLSHIAGDGFSFRTKGATTVASVNEGASSTAGWKFVCGVRSGKSHSIYVNGVLAGTTTATAQDVSNTTAPLNIGGAYDQTLPTLASLALLRISATAPTADQIAKIYDDEKVLFQPNAKATLTGTSDVVTALAHDPDTNLLHVGTSGTSGGRSVFQGLRRVEEHTGTDSQSLAAISAVDGLVVEGK
jgi:hypothetical protein